MEVGKKVLYANGACILLSFSMISKALDSADALAAEGYHERDHEHEGWMGVLVGVA